MTPSPSDLGRLQKAPRREFSAATKRAVRERSGGTCEVHLVPQCMYPAIPEACDRPATDYDHVTPCVFEGDNSSDNCAFLCYICHKIKTVTDNKEAKRTNRLRGEAGQLARRERNGSQIKSRNQWPPKGSRKIPSRRMGR